MMRELCAEWNSGLLICLRERQKRFSFEAQHLDQRKIHKHITTSQNLAAVYEQMTVLSPA